MSKMDNLRAMREAKYARAQERGTPRTAGPSTSASTTAAKRAPRAAAAPTRASTSPPASTDQPASEAPTEASTETSEELCGHRNMGGRTCTRERGHAAKSHRYS